MPLIRGLRISQKRHSDAQIFLQGGVRSFQIRWKNAVSAFIIFSMASTDAN